MSKYRDFGIAKEKLKNIFLGIQDYGASASEHIIDLSETCPDVIDGNELNHLLEYRLEVDAMYEVFTHTRMKVAVFGRASSGKSTVINAMLGENVLPSGSGRATNCFLQVEESHTGNAYLCTEGSLSIQHSVESATDLAYTLNSYIKPDTEELVHVCWPKEKCRLLKDDVVLVDSPGIDTTPYLDEFIYGHYIDADAFVLVVNAESASMDAEINFLHTVSKELPNANIFILFNRWDEYDSFHQKYKQKIKRNIDLLNEKLKECTNHGQYCQTFFIAAKEVLNVRIKGHSELQPSIGPLSERYFEFIEFERQLENCISTSALLKFFNYSMNGKFMLSKMHIIMDIINVRILEQIHLNTSQKNEIDDELNVSAEQFEMITIPNSPITAVGDSLTVEQNLPLKSWDGKTQIKSLGGMVLAGFMYKTIGWSPIIATAAIYGGLCLYEYLSSTTKAIKQSLKNQNVDRATSNVQPSVSFTSANYSQQVQQELPTTFAQSDQLFDELPAININEEMTYADSDFNILTNSTETPNIFVNDVEFWLNESLIQLHNFLVDRIYFFD